MLIFSYALSATTLFAIRYDVICYPLRRYLLSATRYDVIPWYAVYRFSSRQALGVINRDILEWQRFFMQTHDQVLVWAGCVGGVRACRFLKPGLLTCIVPSTPFSSGETDYLL